MNDDLELGILTPLDLKSPSNGRLLFREIFALIPDALPQRFGNFEPLEQEFSGENFDMLLDHWANPFLWKRRRPRVDGSVWFGRGMRHSCHYLTLASRAFALDAVVHYFRKMFEQLEGDYGYLHIFTLEELQDRTRNRRLMPFRRGVATSDLKNGIPDVTGLVALGQPYVDMFGVSRLLSSPAAKIEQLARGAVLLHTAVDPRQSKVAFAEFDRRREVLKEHLGRRAFQSDGNVGRPQTPEFAF